MQTSAKQVAVSFSDIESPLCNGELILDSSINEMHSAGATRHGEIDRAFPSRRGDAIAEDVALQIIDAEINLAVQRIVDLFGQFGRIDLHQTGFLRAGPAVRAILDNEAR